MILKRLTNITLTLITFSLIIWLGLTYAILKPVPSASPIISFDETKNPFFPPYELNRERIGYNKTSNHNATVLNAGWYMDWGANVRAPVNNLPYARTIYFHVNGLSSCQAATEPGQVTVNYTGTALIENVQANPGALWLIGNESDSYYNGSPIYPELYAELYHYFYTTIKATDPKAQVAMNSIVQASPLRMEYLDNVRNHYQATYGQPIESDLWQIHLYRLNEGTCGNSWGASVPPGSSSNQGWNISFTPGAILNLNALEQSVRDFRQWMYDRGYGDKPLLITEYGILPPPNYNGFENEVAAQFLNDTFDMFLTITDPTTGLSIDGNRLVQGWGWFSTDHQPALGNFKYGGDLFNADNTLTLVGDAFITQTARFTLSQVTLSPLEKTLGGFSSRYIITNTGEFATTAFHHFYPLSGTLNTAIFSGSSVIPPQSVGFFDLAAITQLQGGYAGYVVVKADMPISGTLVDYTYQTPTPSPTPMPTITPTATTTPTLPTITPTITATPLTATPMPGGTITATPLTATPTASATVATSTPAPTPSLTAPPTIGPTATPLPTPTPAPFTLILESLQKNSNGLSSRYVVTNTGNASANIAHEFYQSVGQVAYLVHTKVTTIAINSTQVQTLSHITALPDGYTGYVLLNANQPLTAELLSPITPTPTPLTPVPTPTPSLTPTPQATEGGQLPTNTPKPTGTPAITYSLILDGLQKDVAGVTSLYIVTNTTQTTATTGHAFYSLTTDGGILVHQQTSILPSQSIQRYNLATIDELPANYKGYVVIKANQLIAGNVLNITLNELYVPLILK